MKLQPGFEHAERIAFATSEPGADDRRPDLRVANGQPAIRWTELSVYYDRQPAEKGRPWIAISRGLSTHAGERTKEEMVRVGTLERALKLFSPDSQLGRSVITQAQDWLDRNQPRQPLAIPQFTSQEDALRWLYGDAFDELTPAGLLSRDFGAGEGTVRAALKDGRDVKIPLLAAVRFIDRDRFRAAVLGGAGLATTAHD